VDRRAPPGEDHAVRVPGSGSCGAARASGLLVLSLIVVAGLLSGVVYYRYARSRQAATLAAEMAAVPSSPEERLTLWLRYSAPQIHHRLTQVARFSPEKPWLVTHAVARADGPPELWGIDCEALSRDIVRQEGLVAVVALPHPRALGRAELEAGQGERVPLFAPEVALDADQRLVELALYLLEGLPRALERDIPGAHLEVRPGG